MTYDMAFCREHRLIPLRTFHRGAELARCASSNGDVLPILRQWHGGRLSFQEVSEREMDTMLAARAAGSIGAGSPGGGTGGAGNETVTADRLRREAGGAPVVEFVASTIEGAIERGAGDIHIEAREGEGLVRYRIDGLLESVRTLDAAVLPAIAARIKILAGLDISERRRPQEGRVSAAGVDIRVSVVPVAAGESLVLRLLSASETRRRLPELGFDEGVTARLEAVARRSTGLFLATGPTGAGKTTTLHAILRSIMTPRVKVITIEDPVEYRVTPAVQIQVAEHLGLSFPVLLKRVLRQDPDVILVGEIRDEETARLAVQAAATGHLVLSTLHSTTAAGAHRRLLDFGVSRLVLDEILIGIISQRLVRRRSAHGFRGRLPVAELLVADRAGGELHAYDTLLDAGRRAVAAGLTTQTELERVL